MPLVDMKDLLQHASREGYCVCAFDLAGLDFLTAVTAAAENARAPVILGVAEPHLAYVVAEHFLPAVEAAARHAAVPIAIQYNHATSATSAARAVGLGCNSVALNGRDPVLEVRIARARAVVEMAHARGVPVEGGLNAILRVSDVALTDAAVPEAVHEFVERSGVDFLAIAGEGTSARFRIDFKRLAQLRNEIGIPLTVDGNHRFSETEHRQLIEGGVAMVHRYAGLSRAAAEHLRRNVRATHRNGYLSLVKGMHETIRAEVDGHLRLSVSAGRAHSAQAHCRPWVAVSPDMAHQKSGSLDS